MPKSTVTIWHKPNCSTSRNALKRLKEKGIEPELYLYVDKKPSKAEIEALLKKLKLKPSQLLRRKEPEAKALEDATEAQILSAMAKNAILIERPVVIAKKGAVIARPIEQLDTVL
jgi:arsenate reductase